MEFVNKYFDPEYLMSFYEHHFEPEDMSEVLGSPFSDLLKRPSTLRHRIAQHPAGRTLHETRGLTAICTSKTVRLSCCSDKLLQVTIVCACGSKIYHNASQTHPVKPIGWKKEAGEGAYGRLHHARNGAVQEDELILTIILRALVTQQSGSVMERY